MKINNASIITSAVNEKHYPEHDLPEILLLGRSNVGKSSFINTIINRRNLARTSSQPGKTRTINFYNIEDIFSFVDMPGYGYAKVSKNERKEFRKMISEYIWKRENLMMVVQLIDFRHPPSKDDIAVHQWLLEEGIRPLIVATKMDKVKRSEYNKNIHNMVISLELDSPEEIVLFSAEKKYGKEEVLGIIDELLEDIG